MLMRIWSKALASWPISSGRWACPGLAVVALAQAVRRTHQRTQRRGHAARGDHAAQPEHHHAGCGDQRQRPLQLAQRRQRLVDRLQQQHLRGALAGRAGSPGAAASARHRG
jgi:hypothetical protein